MRREVDVLRELIGGQYPIVEGILKYLPFRDIVGCQRVSKLWNFVSHRVLYQRRCLVELFSWRAKAPPEMTHPWMQICGNQLLSIHSRIGLHSSLSSWINESLRSHPGFIIVFAKGVYYLSYLKSIQCHLVVIQELQSARHIQRLFRNPSTTFFTALKLMDTTDSSTSDEDLPDVTVLSIPPCFFNKEAAIVSFNVLDSEIDLPDIVDTKISFELLCEYFYGLTGVDPSKEKILGIIVFNLGDMSHFVRRLYEDLGPFSFIGCDSEALSWSFPSLCEASTTLRDNYDYCSTGFIIKEVPFIRTGSVVLDISVRTEKDIIDKLRPFVDLGLTGYGSWAILLSSCVRGYQGEDIDSEIIRQKNYLQKLECDTFKRVCTGTKLIAAQVEDIYGVDFISQRSGVPLFSDKLLDKMNPQIISDDSSTVIFIFKYL